jgi:hypothetical protein
MQHGSRSARAEDAPEAGGFTGEGRAEGHICCGSAGTYNLLQPRSPRAARPQGRQHRARQADLIATGNIGCITQIAQGTAIPLVPHGRTPGLGDRRAMPVVLKDAGFEARLAPNAAGVGAE